MILEFLNGFKRRSILNKYYDIPLNNLSYKQSKEGIPNRKHNKG